MPFLADNVAISSVWPRAVLGREMEVPWETTAAKRGRDSFHEEEHQEAQTPDGNRMCFLGPERIFGTMARRGGCVGKGLLDILKQVEPVGLTFVSLKDVYVISELCAAVRPAVYKSRAGAGQDLH